MTLNEIVNQITAAGYDVEINEDRFCLKVGTVEVSYDAILDLVNEYGLSPEKMIEEVLQGIAQGAV